MRLVLILAVFNYAGFFLGSLSAVLDAVSLPYGRETLRFLLPMGLSFHVFMAISYVVDATAGKLPVARNPLIFFAYMTFYSDMAIGIGKLCGIRLRTNFSCPYFAVNIADFWRWWHITFASAVRFAKALRLDFFPQLVQPTTGGSAYLPSQVIDIFPQEEPQPISRNISIP